MTITPPGNVSYGTVIWQAVTAEIDSADGGTAPDFNAILPTSTVTFTPTVVKVVDATATPNPLTIIGSPVVANIGPDGYLGVKNGDTFTAGVELVATDDPDLNPVDWAYNVTYNIRGTGNRPITLASHLLYVPSGATIDLSLVIPPSSATPIGVPAAEAAAAIAAQAALDALAAAEAAEAAATGAGRPVSTDGSYSLPTPSGVGLEFVITADVLEDITMNGVPL